MPALSQSQQQSAGIAHAVKKGELPASKLKGASKQMFQSMKDSSLKHFAKTKSKELPKHVEGTVLTAKGLFLQERDDLATGKVNVPAETKSYARMTSKSVMHQPGGTSDKWRKSLNLRKAITNQRGVKGFTNKDAVGKVPHAMKESKSPEEVVKAMLD